MALGQGILPKSLFFFARGGLYSTDGTSVSLVTDDAIGCSIQHKGDFYYGGQGEDNIDRLYRTDGEVTSVIEGIAWVRQLHEFNEELVAATDTGLYRTDGISVAFIGDFEFATVLTEFAGELVFTGKPTAESWGVFSTDGIDVTRIANVTPSRVRS